MFLPCFHTFLHVLSRLAQRGDLSWPLSGYRLSSLGALRDDCGNGSAAPGPSSGREKALSLASRPLFLNAETITLQPFAVPPVGSGIKAEVLNAPVMTVWGDK